MITLITGAPGAGKTAALVDMLTGLSAGRDLFVNNVTDLKIPHTNLEDPHQWMTVVPDGAVIVLDEVQDVWRARGPGVKVPADITALETHRHRGLDFYIITQGPNLIDANVRALVGRHVHLRDIGILGRWWYEWPECSDQCRNNWKVAPIKKRYKLPKRIFDKYKSSSFHIKPVRAIPRTLVVFVLAIFLGIYLIYKGYESVKAKTAPPKPPSSPQNSQPGLSAPLGQALQRVSAPDERVDFVPRISGRPWTAPAYDALRVVVKMPIITGAVCVDDDCTCYHKKRVVDMVSKDCQEWVKTNPFSPYENDGAPVADSQTVADRAPPDPAK